MKVVALFKQATDEWISDRAPQLGAALAFYSAFSLVPLLALIIALASKIIGSQSAEREVLRTAQVFMGGKVSESVTEMLQWSKTDSSGSGLSTLGVIALLLSASGVFGELQSTMNLIWNVTPKPSSGVFDFLKTRFFSILMVLGTAFLLLISLALTTALSAAQNYLWGDGGSIGPLALLINSVVSLLVVTGVFALILKYIPDTRIEWRDVLPGAIFTAILFEAGKFGIGWYLARPSVSAAFGTAASIIVVLLWVYYSAQILFFGAELTQVYAKFHGSLSERKTKHANGNC